MTMHGPNGVGCPTPMTSAARRAAADAATACHVPALTPPLAGRRAPQAGAANAPGSPAAPECARPMVRGGGAAAPAAVSQPNPAIAALAGMLGDATPPERGPTLAQQLQLQVTTLLGALGSRLAALMPDGSGDATATGLATSASDGAGDAARPDPSLLLRQPPPPIGPVLTLDPALGVIVDPAGAGDPDGDGRAGGTGALDEPGLPSSWVAVPGSALRRVRERLGSVADRIDALLAEVGMTRLQLLLLMVLGPVAVAFALDVVSQLLDAR